MSGTAAGKGYVVGELEAGSDIQGLEVALGADRDRDPWKNARRPAFMAGRLAPHSGPVRASCASRLIYRLTITPWSLLRGGFSIPLRMSAGIFVQHATAPARGCHRQAHQVLVLLSDSKVKAVAFHPAEEFPASPASPLAIQRFLPSIVFGGVDAPLVGDIFAEQDGKRYDRILTDS